MFHLEKVHLTGVFFSRENVYIKEVKWAVVKDEIKNVKSWIILKKITKQLLRE